MRSWLISQRARSKTQNFEPEEILIKGQFFTLFFFDVACRKTRTHTQGQRYRTLDWQILGFHVRLNFPNYEFFCSWCMTLIWRPAYRKQGHFSTWLNLKKKYLIIKINKVRMYRKRFLFLPILLIGLLNISWELCNIITTLHKAHKVHMVD